MKKILVGILKLVTVFTLLGCQQVEEQMEQIQHPNYEKIEDVDALLDKLLEHIADHDGGLVFADGELVDAESGIPHFDIVSISNIPYFKNKDVVDGFVVRPIVDVDNPKLLIVVKAIDENAGDNLDEAMLKVLSDQHVQFRDAGMMSQYLIDNNRTIRQGNYFIYVTWENPEGILRVFEQHVR